MAIKRTGGQMVPADKRSSDKRHTFNKRKNGDKMYQRSNIIHKKMADYTKNTTSVSLFFSKNSKWRFFFTNLLRCSNLFKLYFLRPILFFYFYRLFIVKQ
jgi:hypothetical protein